LPRADAVVLSDYAKGVLTPRLIRTVIERARKLKKPVIVDPKGNDFSIYRGATIITPNRKELGDATRLAVGTVDELAAAKRADARDRQQGGRGHAQRRRHAAANARQRASACAGLFGEGA